MESAPHAEIPQEVVGGAPLAPAGTQEQGADQAPPKRIPAAALASRLIDAVAKAGTSGLLHIANGENGADEIARTFKCFVPEAQVIVLPPWDCLPYDRVAPSRECMGRRAGAIDALSRPAEGQRLIVASVEAALQPLPPAEVIAQGFVEIAIGDKPDTEALRAQLERSGYILDDRVDEAGEAAFLGRVADIFPADAARPVRMVFGEDGAVADIRAYDPLTQRTEDSVERVRICPATELFLSPEEQGKSTAKGMEERMLGSGQERRTLFDLLPTALVTHAPGLSERAEAVLGLVAEARRGRAETSKAVAATDFYLTREAWNKALKGRKPQELAEDGLEAAPNFTLEADPNKALADFIGEHLGQGFRVALAGQPGEIDRTAKSLSRKLKQKLENAADCAAVRAAEPGTCLLAPFDLLRGFVDAKEKIAIVAAADLHGGRLYGGSAVGRDALSTEPELKLGDVVLHEDHGIGVLRALETVEVSGQAQDTVRLEFHGGASLLAPVEEFGRIWRYGADEATITLDRLNGDGWHKRRATVSGEIDAAAQALVKLAHEREAAGADKIKPPRAAYARFAAGFPYPETPDQSAAIEAVLADLASGVAMNRLICGDVGFGKTEIALRAAAAVALSGKQVAVVAPTTVLARQHFDTFSRRFAGTDVAVAHLSRVVGPAEAKRVREGLASGEIGIVVGTHAVGAKDTAFADLGLVVIDEEHRFGVKIKEDLRNLAPCLHVLTMSATPIPRTLQGAMVGVQEASLLGSPPARRRPVRTELSPFDAASVRTALIREQRRGGQSFFVAPRVEDLDGIEKQLKTLVPEMDVRIGHGGMDAAELDEVMVGFANGEGDILLSTNIIETGLDVPRANTMLIWNADRFGLAQLHQLRGRVGRGRVQGHAYLLTEPDKETARETRSRLSTLLAFDRLGSGLAISARDLDLRGAGDLVGEDQAGHMKLIGVSLYQKLLARAVAQARGEGVPDTRDVVLNLEASGFLPPDYVPEPAVRMNLYARLQRFTGTDEIDAFAEEIEDRFGPAPPEAAALLSLARLRLSAAAFGVSRIDAGPLAVAFDFWKAPSPALWAQLEAADCKRSGERLVCKRPTQAGPERLELVEELLRRIGPENSSARKKAA